MVPKTGDDAARRLAKADKKRRKQEQRAAAAAAAAATTAAAAKPAKKPKKPKVDAAAADEAAAAAVSDKDKAARKAAKKAAKQAATGEQVAAASDTPTLKKRKKGAAGSVVVAGDEASAKLKTKKLKASANGAAAPAVAAPSGKYTPHAAVLAMSDADVSAFQAERSIVVEGSSARPVTAFEHAGFAPELLRATAGFAAPSAIQAQGWPIVLAGHDLVGIAATGSGKTLAFGLPALQRIMSRQGANAGNARGVTVLVLAPTRELALQINQVLEEAGAPAGIASVCVYGGVPKREQVAALRAGARVVVGTPGRIQDLMGDATLDLSRVDYCVLDEADRMLDLGFEPAVRAILDATAPRRQTLMFSATWPQLVQKLAAEFLRKPVKVTVGSQSLSASHSVTQHVEVVEQSAKEARLLALLARYHNKRNRVLVFVLYKKEAARMEALLQRKGWDVAAVHGDLNQAQRTQAVEAFKNGTCPLLLATDVAARGLDIPDVEAVINLSFPLTVEDYVHRIGRTGRAGKLGVAHTLFCGATDKARAGELINVLREANQTVPPELLKFGTTVKKKESKLYGAHFKDIDHTAKAKKVTFDSDDDD